MNDILINCVLIDRLLACRTVLVILQPVHDALVVKQVCRVKPRRARTTDCWRADLCHSFVRLQFAYLTRYICKHLVVLKRHEAQHAIVLLDGADVGTLEPGPFDL